MLFYIAVVRFIANNVLFYIAVVQITDIIARFCNFLRIFANYQFKLSLTCTMKRPSTSFICKECGKSFKAYRGLMVHDARFCPLIEPPVTIYLGGLHWFIYHYRLLVSFILVSLFYCVWCLFVFITMFFQFVTSISSAWSIYINVTFDEI